MAGTAARTRSTCSAAATGTARIAPIKPSMAPPTRSASTTPSAGSETTRFMTIGTTVLASTSWMTSRTASTRIGYSGLMVKPSRTAGTTPMIPPTIGIAAVRPAKMPRMTGSGRRNSQHTTPTTRPSAMLLIATARRKPPMRNPISRKMSMTRSWCASGNRSTVNALSRSLLTSQRKPTTSTSTKSTMMLKIVPPIANRMFRVESMTELTCWAMLTLKWNCRSTPVNQLRKSF